MLGRNVSVTRALARSLTHAQKLDPVQEALLSEPCLLVDTEDRVLGPASKRACHEVSGHLSNKSEYSRLSLCRSKIRET